MSRRADDNQLSDDTDNDKTLRQNGSTGITKGVSEGRRVEKLPPPRGRNRRRGQNSLVKIFLRLTWTREVTGQKFAEAKTRLSQQTFAILVVAGRMFEDSNVFFTFGPDPRQFVFLGGHFTASPRAARTLVRPLKRSDIQIFGVAYLTSLQQDRCSRYCDN